MFYFDDNFDSETAKTFKNWARENQASGLVYSISKVTEGFGQRLAEFIGVKEFPTVRFIRF